MEITYDENADAMYIRLSKGSFFENKVVDDITILDFDKDGHLLGIELLDVKKRIPNMPFDKISIRRLGKPIKSLALNEK